MPAHFHFIIMLSEELWCLEACLPMTERWFPAGRAPTRPGLSSMYRFLRREDAWDDLILIIEKLNGKCAERYACQTRSAGGMSPH